MARVKTDNAVCDFATLEFAADIDHECKTTSVDKLVGDKRDAQFHRKINRRSVPGLRRSIVLRKSEYTWHLWCNDETNHRLLRPWPNKATGDCYTTRPNGFCI